MYGVKFLHRKFFQPFKVYWIVKLQWSSLVLNIMANFKPTQKPQLHLTGRSWQRSAGKHFSTFSKRMRRLVTCSTGYFSTDEQSWHRFCLFARYPVLMQVFYCNAQIENKKSGSQNVLIPSLNGSCKLDVGLSSLAWTWIAGSLQW